MPEEPIDESESSSGPPPALGADLATMLESADVAELKAAITYAKMLLPTKPAPAELIEEQPGEEILEVTPHDSYTTVLKEQPCVEGCDDCPHGPYLYRVRADIHPDDEEPRLHWSFLGRVSSDDRPGSDSTRE